MKMIRKERIKVFLSGFVFGFLLVISNNLLAETAKISPGQWLIYQVEKTDQKGKMSEFSLKYLIVSQESGQYWIEVAITEKDKKQIYKFLAPLKEQSSYLDKFEFWGQPSRLIIQQGSDEPKEVQPENIARYMPVIIEVPKRSASKLTEKPNPTISNLASEEIVVDQKKLKCSHTKENSKEISEVNLGFINIEDTNLLEIELWSHPDIPITGAAMVKAEATLISKNKNLKDQQPTPRSAITNMKLTKFGTKGATSEITGTPKMMEPITFPFLQLIQQTPTHHQPKETEKDKK